MNFDNLIRSNIRNLKPYSSARDEFSGEAMVFLDANENPFNEPYNRYPDPLQKKLKVQISQLKNTAPENIFLGNGSDEPIDLLFRAFCEPRLQNAVTIHPTYGMYEVAAAINDIQIIKVSLNDDFSLNPEKVLQAADDNTKLIFLCSPNNPTGNSLGYESIIKIVQNFDGIVILDEAYVDFDPESSLLPQLKNYSNLVILQTFSKAWGMAGLRLGMAFAHIDIIHVLNKIKYPYNLNNLTQLKAIEFLENKERIREWVKLIIAERTNMSERLITYPFVEKVYPSDANFILVKVKDAKGIYNFLTEKGIIVRDRSKIHLCDQSLRITIGTTEENNILLKTLQELI